MKVNWIVRFKNVNFWISFIPAILVLVEGVSALLGYKLDLSETGEQILNVVRQVFIVLAVLGVVNDPTTSGLSDSERAMSYDEPA